MLLLAFFDDEPGAEVYSLATKEAQAKLSWNDGAQFVAKNASIARRVRKVGKRLVNEASASFWMPLGRDSDTGDQGINAHGGSSTSSTSSTAATRSTTSRPPPRRAPSR